MMTALQCIIIEIGIVRVEEASELGVRKGKAWEWKSIRKVPRGDAELN